MSNKLALDWFEKKITKATVSLSQYVKENSVLLSALAFVALAAYGFELFNLNITIDEEIHATLLGPTHAWIQQGRWGMFLLNKFIFPYTIIPFMPLFVALVFNIAALMLLSISWGVESKIDQFLIGSVGLAFPTIAYMYTFSTINYGIGIGLFCVALSLFVYSRVNSFSRLFAVVPASFSVAIYQGFLPVLLSAFLVYIIMVGFRTGKLFWRDLFSIATILVVSYLFYYLGQTLLVRILDIPRDTYVAGYFDFTNLFEDFNAVVTRLFSSIHSVYLGDKSVFVINMPVIGIMIAFALISFNIILWRKNLNTTMKVLLLLASLFLVIIPFISGIFMIGYLSTRFLIALPITVSAIIMLGMTNGSKVTRTILFLLTNMCIFQSLVSTNRLFASSHLALQADRLLASRLIIRIDDAVNESNNLQELKYLEVVGSLSRPPTQLIPQAETFGASFFNWDDGNPIRIAAFLETIGYYGLHPLPVDGRIQMVSVAENMPNWPAKGSVMIVDETVLVKFGPYSNLQKTNICSGINNTSELSGFCP